MRCSVTASQIWTVTRRGKRHPAYSILSWSTIRAMKGNDDLICKWIYVTHAAAIKIPQKPTTLELDSYPTMPSSCVALYWQGDFIKAAEANSTSFLELSIFFDKMPEAFTNYRRQRTDISQSKVSDVKDMHSQSVKMTYIAWWLPRSTLYLHESYQRHVEGFYPQIPSSYPMARLQRQLV